MHISSNIRISFCCLLATAMAACSCKKQEEPDTPVIPEPSGSVRLYLEDIKIGPDSLALSWQSGDKVLVNGKIFYASLDKDGRALVTVPSASVYAAFYPADIIASDVTYIQPVQYKESGKPGSRAFPCCANSNGRTLRFSAMTGFLRIMVKGSGQIASVNIRDNAGGKLCGTFTRTDSSLESCPGISFAEVSLNCRTAAGGSATLDQGGTVFYLAVPAADYPKGFMVTVSGKDGKSVQKNYPSAVNVKAGEAVTLDQFDYSVPKNQIFSLHFDNFVAGGDPVAGVSGFNCTSYVSPNGFEFYTGKCDVVRAGAAVMSSKDANKYFDLSKSYQYSRNVQDFTEVCQCQEFHGCMGCGATRSARAVFKLPAFSGIPDGKVCKAELNMKVAGLKGENTQDIDILPTYSTTGKILELWIDGEKVADHTPTRTVTSGSMGDGTRWSSADDANSITVSSFAVERVRIKASELSDGKWHDVRVVMGSVTKATVIQIFSHSSTSTSCIFFLDDIEATVSDYDLPSSFLEPSWILGLGQTTTSYFKNQARHLGFKQYIDIGIGPTFFTSRNWDEANIIKDLTVYADAIKNAGFKVWNIHLPATDENDSYDTDIFEYFQSDKALRQAAVDRTKIILRCVKLFESVNLMVHATGPGRNSYDFDTYKDYGVDSFRQLTEYCNSADMRYSDCTYPVFCIENIQNTGTMRKHVNALAEYMNYYCEKVPGLKICLDTSHAQVCMDGGESAVEYCRKLGNNICAVHIHGNGLTTKDRHIYPGYKDGLYYSTGGNDLIDWAQLYKTLREDCGYEGPFSYEIGSNAADCIASFSNIVHNYYTAVLEPYKSRYVN